MFYSNLIQVFEVFRLVFLTQKTRTKYLCLDQKLSKNIIILYAYLYYLKGGCWECFGLKNRKVQVGNRDGLVPIIISQISIG